MELIEPPAHSSNCPPPVARPSPVTVELPAHAIDSHCHVFGPHAVFPFAARRTFTPVDVPRQDLRARHDLLGFERAVIVQSACHGADHTALLDALETSDGRYRGVAVVAADTRADTVVDWAARGVCGARLNFLPHLGGAPSAQVIDAVVELIAPHGWHLAVHVAGDGVLRHRAVIDRIPVPVVLDHMGRVDLSEGLDGPGPRALLDLLDTGSVWVKLSGADRLSHGPVPTDTAVRLAARLAAHAPTRVVWGTDFPHPNLDGAAPDDGVLVNTLDRVLPDPALRREVLVANPQQLFGFLPPG